MLAAIALCGRPAAAQAPIVSVTSGQIKGVLADGITSFKGIPFAAPPMGELRWRAPQPVKPWTDIEQADRFAPACVQDPNALQAMGAPPAMSEDCLYLNLWTPARSAHERLPVMVWIYGGGFVLGTTSAPTYDGTHLAQKGVVLVSVAHRVGALGFLADAALSAESPHQSSGNYGMLDVIAALQWVQANIGKFGGDPSRVTLFGQSSGAGVVAMLAASPLAKGLLQRAISESGGVSGGGGPYALPNLHVAETTGKRFLAMLGARDIAAARALPAAALVKAQGGAFVPIDDGYVLAGDEYELYRAGRFNDTPLLLGTNSNEGEMLVPPGATPARFEAQMRAQFGSHADAILALYPHATDAEAEQATRDVERDSVLAWSTWAWARLHSQRGTGKVHLYYFDRRSPQAPRGPTHGAEIGYVFGNLLSPVSGAAYALSGTPGPADAALSELIQSYWVNFAKTGDPNGPGLPPWPAFGASDQQAMFLNEHPGPHPVPNMRQIEVFDSYYASRRKAEPRAVPTP
jgi:para-nitrobenzyl esterase